MRKTKRGIFCAQITMILLMAGTAAMLVYAAISNELIFSNDLKTGSVQIKLNQYQEGEKGMQPIEPGQVFANQDVSYIPEIKNIRADSYVRVKVDIVMDADVPEPITEANICGFNENWVKRGDYYYYVKPLKTFDSAWLFKGFHVPESWEEDKGVGFRISMTADAVQAKNLKPDFEKINPWGTIEIQEEKDSDSIVYRAAEPASLLNVMTFSDSKGFESNTSDLFRNFRHFAAGDSFQDTLKMVNEAKYPVKISFCIDTEPGPLTEQMQVEIRCEGETVYEGPLTGSSMREYVELTELKASDIKDFTFKAILPEESDNVYSALNDQVIWKFKAEKVPDVYGQVQTGDDFSLTSYLAGALAALAVSGMLLLPLKRGQGRWKR